MIQKHFRRLLILNKILRPEETVMRNHTVDVLVELGDMRIRECEDLKN